MTSLPALNRLIHSLDDIRIWLFVGSLLCIEFAILNEMNELGISDDTEALSCHTSWLQCNMESLKVL